MLYGSLLGYVCQNVVLPMLTNRGKCGWSVRPCGFAWSMAFAALRARKASFSIASPTSLETPQKWIFRLNPLKHDFSNSDRLTEMWERARPRLALSLRAAQGRWGAPDRPGFQLEGQSGKRWKIHLKYRKPILRWLGQKKSKLVFSEFLFPKHGKSMPTDRPAFWPVGCAPAPLGVRAASVLIQDNLTNKHLK